MEQSEKWNRDEILTLETLKKLLAERFRSIDFNSARSDVEIFLKEHDREGLSVWDAAFFEEITERFLK